MKEADSAHSPTIFLPAIFPTESSWAEKWRAEKKQPAVTSNDGPY
jgi:hypothetical protein